MKITTFSNGTIKYVSHTDEVPETNTSTKEGNVTINNIRASSPAIPAHFITNFFIGFSQSVGGVDFHNHISLEGIVLHDGSAAPYSEIENAGAQSLPTALRELADLIDNDIVRSEAERLARENVAKGTSLG